MNDADLIWNRAAMENGGDAPSRGDTALSSLLYAHGLVMNGGVLHAAELLTDDELSAAQDGYRFFGLEAIAELLQSSRRLVYDGRDLDAHEARLDAKYVRHVPADSALCQRFERHFRSHPADFSPL